MAVLRHRDFRNLFIGQSASVIGDGIVLVALALYVTEIGTPTDVGLVLAAYALPLVAFLAFGGVWADRMPRQKLMIASDLARFALRAALAALIFAGTVEIWHIVVIEALVGAAEAFSKPAQTGLLPQDGARGGDPLPVVIALFVVCGAGLALFGVWWDTPLGSREVMVGGAIVSIAVLTGGLLVRETWTLRRLERAPA
jgi:MFS family permease